jgi:hypothetical protein
MNPPFFGWEFLSDYDSFHKKWLLWSNFVLWMTALYLTLGYVYWGQPYSSLFQYCFAGVAALELLVASWYSARRCVLTYFLDATWLSIIFGVAIWAILENEIGSNARFQYALYVLFGTSFLYFAAWTQRLTDVDINPNIVMSKKITMHRPPPPIPAHANAQPGQEGQLEPSEYLEQELEKYVKYSGALESAYAALSMAISKATSLQLAKEMVKQGIKRLPVAPTPPEPKALAEPQEGSGRTDGHSEEDRMVSTSLLVSSDDSV